MQAMTRLFRARKTTLLFVLRDHTKVPFLDWEYIGIYCSNKFIENYYFINREIFWIKNYFP